MHQHLKNACRDDPRALDAIDEATQRGRGNQAGVNQYTKPEESGIVYIVHNSTRDEDGLNQAANPAASRGVNGNIVTIDPQDGMGQCSKPGERGTVSNIHSSSPGVSQHTGTSKGNEEETTLYNIQGRFRCKGSQNTKPEERGTVYNVHSSSLGVAQHHVTSRGSEEETNGNIVTIRFKYKGNQNTKPGESGILYIIQDSTSVRPEANQPANQGVNVSIRHIDPQDGRNQFVHCTS